MVREFDQAQQALRVQLAAVRQQYMDEVDSEFWVALVFQSAEQKHAFVESTGWEPLDEATRYVSGTKVAGRLGIQLPPGPLWRAEKTKSEFAALARRPFEDAEGPAEAEPSDPD